MVLLTVQSRVVPLAVPPTVVHVAGGVGSSDAHACVCVSEQCVRGGRAHATERSERSSHHPPGGVPAPLATAPRSVRPAGSVSVNTTGELMALGPRLTSVRV